MNVDEVLNYEAVKTLDERLKVKSAANSHDYQSSKKQKKDHPNTSSGSSVKLSASADHLTEKEKLEVLRVLESEPETELFNEASLRKLITQLEKRINKNQEMRIKFPDTPDKFMESELELNDIIQEMHVISTRPDFYPILLESNFIQLTLSLLSHENIDISTAVISLIQELTDFESSAESLESFQILINALCEQQLFSQLIFNLERLDEKKKDEADAVHNIFAIVENIFEMNPSISLDTTKNELFKWLLKRIKIKGSFDANKLYAAELLAILVQNSDENRHLLGELNGIDILLQQIAYYKKRKPSTADEFEYMENLFDCLCSCLMLSFNRDLFLKGEGLQLMRLILREQVSARNSALKVLSYAMNMNDSKESCHTFVDMLGLAILFPLFMKPVTAKSNKNKNDQNNEEHIVSIIASLLKNCSGLNRQRVISKFVENDFEKVDRIVELFFKYLEQVNQADLEIEKEKQEADEEIDEDREDEFYIQRLENGLFTLQLIAYIITDICANGPNAIKSRIFKLLNMRRIQKDKLLEILNEYLENLGDETTKDQEDMKQERERIEEMMKKL